MPRNVSEETITKPVPMVCARATASGGSTFAHRWRRTIQPREAPETIAASTYGGAGHGQGRGARHPVEQRGDQHSGDEHRSA